MEIALFFGVIAFMFSVIGIFLGVVALYNIKEIETKLNKDTVSKIDWKARYERCWTEHESHYHIYDPITCGDCPHKDRCGDSICGY